MKNMSRFIIYPPPHASFYNELFVKLSTKENVKLSDLPILYLKHILFKCCDFIQHDFYKQIEIQEYLKKIQKLTLLRADF